MVPAQIAVPTYAALLPPGIWSQVGDTFDLALDFLPINALQTVSRDAQIPSDSDFLIVNSGAIVTSTDDQTATAFFPALVQRTDQGAGRQLETRPQHFHNLFSAGAAGSALLPQYWPLPKLIDRGSTFTTTIQSLFAATNVNVRVVYRGFKLFGKRGATVYDPASLVQIARSLLAAFASQPGAPR